MLHPKARPQITSAGGRTDLTGNRERKAFPASQGLCGVTHRAYVGVGARSHATPQRSHHRAPPGTRRAGRGSFCIPYACSHSPLFTDSLPHIYSYDAHYLGSTNNRPFFWTLKLRANFCAVRPRQAHLLLKHADPSRSEFFFFFFFFFFLNFKFVTPL